MALSELRWAIPRLLTPRRTVRSRGLRFTLQCDNAITHYRWKTYNSKEPKTLDWIDQWMRDGDVLFDVGANIGVYTVYAALRHARLRVVAFEPEYANLHLLRDNVILNCLHDRVEVYGVGISHRSGLSVLHLQDLTPGSALHTESREPIATTRMHRPVIGREGICTVTLDAFCQETGCWPNGIKIDVDGTELQVLQGAAKTLRSPQLRSVILETPDEQEARGACEALLAAAGFERQEDGPPDQAFNHIWVRPSPS